MSNLDSLLSSLLKDASSEELNTPLVSSDDVHSHKRGNNGHIYVGCLALWLLEREALVFGMHIKQQHKKMVDDVMKINPGAMSEKYLDGEIWMDDVGENLKAFVADYVRNDALYPADFEEITIVKAGKNIGDFIPDDKETYKIVANIINQRYALYASGDARWKFVESKYVELELEEWERSEAGWLNAMSQLNIINPVSEQGRRQDLNKFWALVDHSAEIASEKVASVLVAQTGKDLGDGVWESVRNSLANFPFEVAINAIFKDAMRLNKIGSLSEILSPWGNLDKDQVIELSVIFDSLDNDRKLAILSAIREGVRNREDWAREWDEVLSH